MSVWTWARPNDDVDARVLLHAATAVVIIAVFALAGAVPIASMHALAGVSLRSAMITRRSACRSLTRAAER